MLDTPSGRKRRTRIHNAHAAHGVMAVDEYAIDRGAVCAPEGNVAFGLKGRHPALGGQLRIIASNLSHEPRAG